MAKWAKIAGAVVVIAGIGAGGGKVGASAAPAAAPESNRTIWQHVNQLEKDMVELKTEFRNLIGGPRGVFNAVERIEKAMDELKADIRRGSR